MSHKDVPFSILHSAAEDDINSLGQAIGEFGEAFRNMGCRYNGKKSLVVLNFFPEAFHIEKLV